MTIEPVLPRMQWVRNGVSVTLDLDPAVVATALPRMWSRLVRAVDGLAPGDWERPTRCTDWRVVDIVNHLADTTGMGYRVTLAALQGQRSGVFDGFNPRTVPKQLTDAAERDPATVRARFVETLEPVLAGLDLLDVGDAHPAVETPIGRQPIAAALLHLLWDTWLHERDMLLPLGHAVPEVHDEVRLAALYALRMVGFCNTLFSQSAHVPFVLHGGFEGALLLDVSADAVSVVGVDAAAAGAHALRADAATAVDALCGRGDMRAALDGPEELRRQVGSLRLVLAGPA